MNKIILILCVVAGLSSCSSKDGANRSGKYEFYYYPNVNMYYDVAAGQYIFSIDSARTWQTINEVSTQQPATLGEGKIIHTDLKQVWKENEVHRQEYDGTVFNLVASGASVAMAVNEVTERNAPAKKAARPAAEPKKKGIGKFLNNIFGKKKKDQ